MGQQLLQARLLRHEVAIAVPVGGAVAGGALGAVLMAAQLRASTGEEDLLHVEDLPLQGENGLEVAVPPHLGGASGGLALNDEELGPLRVSLGAVGKLAGEAAAVQGVLADHQVSGLARRLPGLLGQDTALHDAPCVVGVVLQIDGQVLGHHGLHQGLDLGVAQLGLGLALELRVHDLDRDHRGQPLSNVLTGQVGLVVLQELLLATVVVDRPGQGGPEAGDVGPALRGVNAVGEGVTGLGDVVGVLEGHVHLGVVHRLLDMDRIMDGLSTLVQVLHHADDTAVVLEGVGVTAGLMDQRDPEARVQVCHLLESLGDDLWVILQVIEDLGVGKVGHQGAVLGRLPRLLEGALGPAALEVQAMLFSVPAALRPQPLG